MIRELRESDHAFVYATYLRNRWFDKDNKTTLKRSTWSTLQHTRLERLFSTQPVLIACLDEDPDTIVGYGFEDEHKPFVYIKLAFRAEGLGVDKMILKELT